MCSSQISFWCNFTITVGTAISNCLICPCIALGVINVTVLAYHQSITTYRAADPESHGLTRVNRYKIMLIKHFDLLKIYFNHKIKSIIYLFGTLSDQQHLMTHETRMKECV